MRDDGKNVYLYTFENDKILYVNNEHLIIYTMIK